MGAAGVHHVYVTDSGGRLTMTASATGLLRRHGRAPVLRLGLVGGS